MLTKAAPEDPATVCEAFEFEALATRIQKRDRVTALQRPVDEKPPRAGSQRVSYAHHSFRSRQRPDVPAIRHFDLRHRPMTERCAQSKSFAGCWIAELRPTFGAPILQKPRLAHIIFEPLCLTNGRIRRSKRPATQAIRVSHPPSMPSMKK
jgi:hypothetical protein